MKGGALGCENKLVITECLGIRVDAQVLDIMELNLVMMCRPEQR